jgi:hypothetical protein
VGKSKSFAFDGGAATYAGTSILALLVVVFSAGFAAPYAIVLRHRWRAKHTLIDGRRLAFLGTGMSLFGRWVLWWLLIIFTLGIYSFWVVPRVTRWVVENTDFADQPAPRRPATARHVASPPRPAISPPQPVAPTHVAMSAPQVRYFTRRWNGHRDDEFSSWGGSEWHFEVEPGGRVLRQVVVYDGGQTLMYDDSHSSDGFGVRTQRLDVEGFASFEVGSTAFDAAWQRPATNR